MIPTGPGLSEKNCKPCKNIPPMSNAEAEQYLLTLPKWVLKGNAIEREFRFKSYIMGLNFGYQVGRVAEQQDHHPEILVGWRRVVLTLTTHSIQGLSENDFIMAAKANKVYCEFGSQ